MACIIGTSMAQEAYPGSPRSHSLEERGRIVGLMSALEAYDQVVHAHENDDASARWVVWSDVGYRVTGHSQDTLALVAWGGEEASGSPVFALASPVAACRCAICAEGFLRGVVNGVAMRFVEGCRGGYTVYRPERPEDGIRWYRWIHEGGRIAV